MELTLEELEALEPGSYTLLDLRSEQETAYGTIPGSVPANAAALPEGRRGKRIGSDFGALRRDEQGGSRPFPVQTASDLKRCRRHSGLMRERASARRSQDRNKTERKIKAPHKACEGKSACGRALVFCAFS